MVIRRLAAGKTMTTVRMLSIIQPVTLAALVVMMSFTGFMAMDDKVLSLIHI